LNEQYAPTGTNGSNDLAANHGMVAAAIPLSVIAAGERGRLVRFGAGPVGRLRKCDACSGC